MSTVSSTTVSDFWTNQRTWARHRCGSKLHMGILTPQCTWPSPTVSMMITSYPIAQNGHCKGWRVFQGVSLPRDTTRKRESTSGSTHLPADSHNSTTSFVCCAIPPAHSSEKSTKAHLGVTWTSYQVCHELERAAQMHLVPFWCK